MVFNYLSRMDIDLEPLSPNWFQVPTWKTLKMLPLKYKTMEELVPNHIGKVFCVDHNNGKAWDLGFCVAL
jgi:hypothetical protein